MTDTNWEKVYEFRLRSEKYDINTDNFSDIEDDLVRTINSFKKISKSNDSNIPMKISIGKYSVLFKESSDDLLIPYSFYHFLCNIKNDCLYKATDYIPGTEDTVSTILKDAQNIMKSKEIPESNIFSPINFKKYIVINEYKSMEKAKKEIEEAKLEQEQLDSKGHKPSPPPPPCIP